MIKVAVKTKIVFRSQTVVQGRILKDNADLLAHLLRIFAHVAAGNSGGSAGRMQDGAKHADGGGFTGAVRSQETKNLSFVHVERDAVNGGHFAKAAGEFVDFNDYIHGAYFSGLWSYKQLILKNTYPCRLQILGVALQLPLRCIK